MTDWQSLLRHDPVPPLLSAKHPGIRYFTRRDLLEETVPTVETLWQQPETLKILNRQQENGAWAYPSRPPGKSRVNEDYDQIETFRQLGILVVKYGLGRWHPVIAKAAKFLFSRQAEEGDFRGIYGNQYSPNYSAAIMELLIQAGYADDPRIERGFQWLLSIRQRDGGWAVPLRTLNAKYNAVVNGPILQPDATKPFSHMITGVVLRAFAAHPIYQSSSQARAAGELLAARFFASDKYPDRQTPEFWTSFSYPFWFTDLLSAMDSLSQMGFTIHNPHIHKAMDWFIANQAESGAWQVKLLRTGKGKEGELWISLGICRVLKRIATA